MKARLTPKFVASAAAPTDGKDRIIYWDDKRPGFGLMVTANGKRSFVLQFRMCGVSHRITFRCELGLAVARRLSRKALVAAAEGLDPFPKPAPPRRTQQSISAKPIPIAARRRQERAILRAVYELGIIQPGDLM